MREFLPLAGLIGMFVNAAMTARYWQKGRAVTASLCAASFVCSAMAAWSIYQ